MAFDSAHAFAAAFVNNATAEGRRDVNDRFPAEFEIFKPIVYMRDPAAEADQTYALALLKRVRAAAAGADRFALILSLGHDDEVGIGLAKESGLVLFDVSSSRCTSGCRRDKGFSRRLLTLCLRTCWLQAAPSFFLVG